MQSGTLRVKARRYTDGGVGYAAPTETAGQPSVSGGA